MRDEAAERGPQRAGVHSAWVVLSSTVVFASKHTQYYVEIYSWKVVLI